MSDKETATLPGETADAPDGTEVPEAENPEAVIPEENATPKEATAPPEETPEESPASSEAPPESEVDLERVRMHIEKERTTEYLRYNFSRDELAEKAQEMARAVSDKTQAEDRLKSIKNAIQTEIAEADAKIRKCSEHLRSGYETRKVDCEKIINHTTGYCTIVRLDTGEVVSCRGLRGHELQIRLV